MTLPLRLQSLGLLNCADPSGLLSSLALASMELVPHAVWAQTLQGCYQPLRLSHEDRRGPLLMAFQQRCVTTIRDLPCDGSRGLAESVRD